METNELKHYGVRGMKWGVRNHLTVETKASQKRHRAFNKGLSITDKTKLKKIPSAADRKKYLDDKDKAWIEKTKSDVKIRKVSSRVAKQMRIVNRALKEEYGGLGAKGAAKRGLHGSLNAQYQKAMKEAYEEALADHTFAVYKMSPSRTREVKITALADGRLKAVVVERTNPRLTKQRAQITKSIAVNAKRAAAEKKREELNISSARHADEMDDDSNIDGMFFIIDVDADGFPMDVIPPFDDLEHADDIFHYGVRGMKWGVINEDRRSRSDKLRKKAMREFELEGTARKFNNQAAASRYKKMGDKHLNKAEKLWATKITADKHIQRALEKEYKAILIRGEANPIKRLLETPIAAQYEKAAAKNREIAKAIIVANLPKEFKQKDVERRAQKFDDFVKQNQDQPRPQYQDQSRSQYSNQRGEPRKQSSSRGEVEKIMWSVAGSTAVALAQPTAQMMGMALREYASQNGLKNVAGLAKSAGVTDALIKTAAKR